MGEEHALTARDLRELGAALEAQGHYEEAAAELRAKHLVAYQRGRLRVLDWAGLEAVAQGVAPPNHNAARV